MLLALALLFACQPSPLTWESRVDGCEDVDLSDIPEPQLDYSVQGSVITVRMLNVAVPTDAAFEPELVIDGRTVEVHEAWTEGAGAETCLVPTVELLGADPGRWEVFWFRPGDEIALDSMAVRVE